MLNFDLGAIQGEIERAGHGQKGAVVLRYAQVLGVTRKTIYRTLAREFGKKKNIERQKVIPDSLIKMVAILKVEGMNLSLKKREPTTEDCIEILWGRGIQGSDKLTVSTVNRRLSENGFRIPTPRVRVEANYVNEEAQIDFSRSKYFQIRKPVGDDWLLKVSGKELHYKYDDRRMRTWICQVKESKSRVRIIRAYAATSEDGFIGLETLNYCFNRTQDDHPMHYLFDNIKTDNGAFSKRAEVRAALESLQVGCDLSKPGNSASQGKVEAGFASLWRRFELKLAMKLRAGATLMLSEYNELLHEWLIETDMKKKHPVENDTREGVYRRGILTHQPRNVEEDILRVSCRVDYRTVSETLMISLNNEEYEAPSYASGKKIRVYKNMLGEVMGEMLDEHKKNFVLKPFQVRMRGDFSNRPHQTYRQLIETEVEQSNREERKAKSDNRLFFKAQSQTVQPESPFIEDKEAAEFASVYLARVYIGGQLRIYGQSYADYAEVFDPMLADDLSKESIDAVLEGVKNMSKMKVATN